MAGPDREPDGLLPTLWRSGAVRIFPILFLYVAGESCMDWYSVGRICCPDDLTRSAQLLRARDARGNDKLTRALMLILSLIGGSRSAVSDNLKDRQYVLVRRAAAFRTYSWSWMLAYT